MPHEIGALDLHIGIRKRDFFGALRVDRQKGDVDLAVDDGIERTAGVVEADELHRDAQLDRETIGKLDGHALRSPASMNRLGKNRIAEIDPFPQHTVASQNCPYLLLQHFILQFSTMASSALAGPICETAS
nr:hypothetical protein [Rhizobium rhizogenes]